METTNQMIKNVINQINEIYQSNPKHLGDFPERTSIFSFDNENSTFKLYYNKKLDMTISIKFVNNGEDYDLQCEPFDGDCVILTIDNIGEFYGSLYVDYELHYTNYGFHIGDDGKEELIQTISGLITEIENGDVCKNCFRIGDKLCECYENQEDSTQCYICNEPVCSGLILCDEELEMGTDHLVHLNCGRNMRDCDICRRYI